MVIITTKMPVFNKIAGLRMLVGAVMVAAILGGALSSCRKAPQWRLKEGAVWNTTYRITYCAPADLGDSIQGVFRQVENSLSPFAGGSLISQINRGATDSVDSLITRVFDISVRVNGLSQGRFDPTVSPVVNLWKFGYTGKVDADSLFEPSQAQIDSALQLVGIADCSIRGGRLVKKAAGTTFNFSAVTKGYACDLILEMLRRNGATDAMVEIGGEVAVAGQSPRGDSWRLQVDAPEFSEDSVIHKPLEIIEVADCGVATSGNYRNFHHDASGRRVGHTIDPRSGRPATSEFLSVTVVAPTCAEADAYATALMATPGRVQADEMLKAVPELKVLLVTEDTILKHNWFGAR